MVRVEEFLDNGKDILRCYSNFSVFHSYRVFVVIFSWHINNKQCAIARSVTN